MNFWKILVISSLIGIFSSCEDVIDVNLDQGRSQLVVDAFLTNDSLPQIIQLSQSSEFFSNSLPQAVNDAKVKLEAASDGKTYNFIGDDNGNFIYDPALNGSLDRIGETYLLELQYEGNTYTASSTLRPVPKIDGMSVAFEEEEIGQEEGYYTQFFARDFPGRKDFYWIRAFRNGEPIDPENPAELILSEDAAFGGEGADGFPFILPIRAAITNEDDPFELGDTSSVELLSMNEDAYLFLQQVALQADNAGLFSTPPANVRPNIFDEFGQTQEEVLGVFSISAISKSSIIAK